MRGRHSTSVPSDLGYREGILLKVNSKGAGKKDPPSGLKLSNYTSDPIGLSINPQGTLLVIVRKAKDRKHSPYRDLMQKH